MRTVHADDRLCNALGQAIARVDELRVKLDPSKPADLFQEFMMRRVIKRSQFAIMQRNAPEALRMLKVCMRICDGAAC